MHIGYTECMRQLSIRAHLMLYRVFKSSRAWREGAVFHAHKVLTEFVAFRDS